MDASRYPLAFSVKNLFVRLQRRVRHATGSYFAFNLSDDDLAHIDSWQSLVKLFQSAATDAMEDRAEIILRTDPERDEWYAVNVNTPERVMAVGYLELLLQLLVNAKRVPEFTAHADRFLGMWDALFSQQVVNDASSLLDATRDTSEPNSVIARLERIFDAFEAGSQGEALTQLAEASQELGCEVDDDEDEQVEWTEPIDDDILSSTTKAFYELTPPSPPTLHMTPEKPVFAAVPPDCDPFCSSQMMLSDDEEEEKPPSPGSVKRFLEKRFGDKDEPPAKRSFDFSLLASSSSEEF